jgi:uncharacterized protein YxeA
MKIVIATVLILVIFFSGAFYLHRYIQLSSERIMIHTEKINQAIEKENWDEAKYNMERLNKDWNKIKKTWLAFIEHLETDEIDVTIKRIERYISLKENTLVLVEIAQLKQLVEHISEKEKIKLTNIL